MLPPQQQLGMAARAGTRFELESGHSPFVSKTLELADLIAGIAMSVDR